MRTYRFLLLLGLSLLPLSSQASHPAESICRGKPAKVMDSASDSLISQLSSRELKVPEIKGCDSMQTGSVLGFDHAGATLYLVEAVCVRKVGAKAHIHAVMECNSAKNKFVILGLSWGGAKGHGVAEGVSIAGQ